MDIVTVMIVRLICMAVMFVAAIVAVFVQNSFVAVMICAGIVVAAAITLIVFSILFWRCPSCGRHLPDKSYLIDYCPHCGKRL